MFLFVPSCWIWNVSTHLFYSNLWINDALFSGCWVRFTIPGTFSLAPTFRFAFFGCRWLCRLSSGLSCCTFLQAPSGLSCSSRTFIRIWWVPFPAFALWLSVLSLSFSGRWLFDPTHRFVLRSLWWVLRPDSVCPSGSWFPFQLYPKIVVLFSN